MSIRRTITTMSVAALAAAALAAPAGAATFDSQTKPAADGYTLTNTMISGYSLTAPAPTSQGIIAILIGL